MKIVGKLPSGKEGELSDAQIKEWLMSLDSRIEKDASGKVKGLSKQLDAGYKQAISKVRGVTEGASGGGNTKYPYDGRALYHESGGAGDTGLTIFFVKRDDVAEVVGLGTHAGKQTYDLIWRRGDWMKKVKTFSLDKKLQGKSGPNIAPQKVPKGGW